MLRNYVLIAIRSIRKTPAYSLINLFGLAIGIASCLIILLYVTDELSADSFHQDANQLYRLVETFSSPEEGVIQYAGSAGPVADAIKASFPEVEETVKVMRFFRPSIHRGNQGYYEADYLVTEPSFFDLFSFEILRGDPAAALSSPGQVILTESAVRKYFGDEDPMGQTLTVSAMGDMTVGAIISDPPRNSHLTFSMLFSMETLSRAFGQWNDFVGDWTPDDRFFVTYVKLRKGTSIDSMPERLQALYASHSTTDDAGPIGATLQPLSEIYFGSKGFVNPFDVRSGEPSYLYIFSMIAIFIIVIACINYMNLATARSLRRSKEVGLRKTFGAFRSQLVGQFLSEAVLTAFLSLAIAVVIVGLVLPGFNGLTNKDLNLRMLESTPLIAATLAIVLLVGIVSGSFPAFHLARFRPAQVLKGTVQRSTGTTSLRRGLVVAQFTLSIAMIIGTLVASDQLDFVRNKHLGFDDTQKLVFDINSGTVRAHAESIKSAFLQYPTVNSVSVTSRVPGDWKQINSISVRPEGMTEMVGATFIGVDADFVETFGVKLLDGRTFEEGRKADSAMVVVNETAARAFGWTDPVGERIQVPNDAIGSSPSDMRFEATVIGVVEDFHFRSLHEPIRPLVLGWVSTPVSGSDYITASVSTDNLPATIAALSEIVHNVDPAAPVEYNFLDQRIQDFYVQDSRVGKLFTLSAAIAILVSCLGLFGLAAFTTEQRTKEIGVRKVLGSSVGGIVGLLSTEYLKLIAFSFLLATPLAYFAMRRWLEEFAYSAPLQPSTFFVAALVALTVGMLTVSYQSIRAAYADPVKSLRYE